ncbi:acyl-CoA thioesterase [Natronolimnohabitans innermongolicus]|uniref:Thioesterase n=1 Tax=Natronolimnohabitans innermongolicus JCM 12255 TaxID=1227499 RepID=L9WLU9_9EURY|nr:thioesterase family protein [Natronolimnohabitans innermongolicus]ELY50439.1 thioesterase [Natronolimnohabitans innermongolicus JCM 12255]
MPHETPITVDWGDTDAGGLIYYPRFFHFVIVGLNDYFAPATDGEHPMESYRREGYVLPAVDASASFHSPLRAGDEAVIETTVVDSGSASLTVAFAVARAETGDPVADGEVSFVFVDDSFDATPLPEELRECIRERGDD